MMAGVLHLYMQSILISEVQDIDKMVVFGPNMKKVELLPSLKCLMDGLNNCGIIKGMTRARAFYFTGIDQLLIRACSCQTASVKWGAGLFIRGDYGNE